MDTDETSQNSLKEMRDAIPKHCFQPSNWISLAYIVRDLVLAFGLAFSAYQINYIEDGLTRCILWLAYGVLQGMFMTGIWILAHECGHQALFTNRLTNDVLGFTLHSMLLVPYFSWKYSHGLHHRYANHMEKDTAFVPYRKGESKPGAWLLQALDISEDAPALNLISLVLHQLFGWPIYLLFNISAGPKSLQRSVRKDSSRQSHLDPFADIFAPKQHPYVLLSDLGLAAMLSALYLLSLKIGSWNVALLYFVPYLWVNNWIGTFPLDSPQQDDETDRKAVAITYLHHTHPSAGHFEAERWNFREGSLATVDRDFGFVGKHIFHGIIEFHVIHHLFTRIPFYHAEEATQAISQVLGDKYLRADTSFLRDLWQTFISCRYVEAAEGAKGVLVWSKS